MAEHVTEDGVRQDADGWWSAVCSCGALSPSVPDLETLVDVLMEHAADAAALPDTEARDLLTKADSFLSLILNRHRVDPPLPYAEVNEINDLIGKIRARERRLPRNENYAEGREQGKQ